MSHKWVSGVVIKFEQIDHTSHVDAPRTMDGSKSIQFPTQEILVSTNTKLERTDIN